MQIKDLIDLQMRLNERYAFFWNFYIVFVTAVLGLIFARLEHVTLTVQAILVFGYLVFVGMNIDGLRAVNRLLIATDVEIQRLASHDPAILPLVNGLCFRDYTKERKWIYIIHLLSGLVVIGLILTGS